jgi:hypothetical protein
MKHAFAFLLLLPAAAAARQDDPYKSLAPGDRVMITFRSGGTLSGTLILLPPGGRPLAKPGGPAPFSVLYFRGDTAECKTQDGILQEWRLKHPEGRIEEVPQGSRTELWQAHGISSVPSLVFKDPASGGQVRASGVQQADRLQDLLEQVRGGEGSKVDYTKETHVTLDMGYEYPGLNGTMTLAKRDIKEIRPLQKLDQVTLQRLAEEKARIRRELEVQNETRRKAEDARDEKAKEALEAAEKEEKTKGAVGNELQAAVEKAERIQKGREYLKKFPPPEWGPERLKQIANKGLTRIPVTVDERQFSEVYDLWLEARKYEEEQQKKKTEKPPEK